MEKLTDKSPMPLGRYKGRAMANVPADYLLHAYAEYSAIQWKLVHDYVRENMEVLEQEAVEQKEDFLSEYDDFID